MPYYDYLCEDCGPFTNYAPMSAFDQPCACPTCASEAPRVLFTAPKIAGMDKSRRTAFETNERAQHEPKRSGHGAGCSCCSGGGKKKSSGTLYRPDGSKSFPAKRPWMISH